MEAFERATVKAFFIIVGSICLALGLYFAFESNRIVSDKLNRLKKGENQPSVRYQKEANEDESKAVKSEEYYYWGIRLTGLGIALNAVGSLM